MDILSHALWGATIIRKKELLPLVIGGSLLPDLGCLPDVFVVLRSYYRDYKKGIKRSFGELLTDWKEIPSRVSTFGVYYFFHSFFTWFMVTVVLFLIGRNYLVISLCYFFHLIIDIPTHREARPFFPFSNFRIKGIYFLDNKWVFLVNVVLLIMVNAIFVFFK